MIILKNVSMKFNLGVEKDNSLKMIFINLFTPKLNFIDTFLSIIIRASYM